MLWLFAACSDDAASGKRGPKRLPPAVPVAEASDEEIERDDDANQAPRHPARRGRLAPRVGAVRCPAGTEPRGSAPPGATESYCILVDTEGRGSKHGPYRGWRNDGTLQLSGSYARGERDGPWKVFRADATLQNESTYAAGDKDGPWTTYHPNGKKSGQGRYREGSKDGTGTFWYDNGQKKADARYRNDLREGPSVNWYRDGAVQSQGEYLAGKKDGPWVEFSPGGASTQTTYKDGLPIR